MSTPLRVLIVEDSEDDTLLVLRELRRGGYEPTYERVDTPDGMSAALNRQAWDVVISDHAMPHFSGPAALALLQARRFDLPFIIVSGTIGEDMAVAAMKAGAHDYLMKDSLARLVPAVERELREAAMRQERKRAEEARKARELELEALVTVAAALRAAPTRGDMLPVILRQVHILLKADGAALSLRNPVTGEAAVSLARGAWENWTGKHLPPGEGIIGHVIADGHPCLDNDVQSHPDVAQPDRTGDLHAVACVPLLVQEDIIGALAIGRQTAIADRELRLLASIGDIAANALHRAGVMETLEQRVLERTLEIRREQERTMTILNSVADAVLVTGLDGTPVLTNPVADTLLREDSEQPGAFHNWLRSLAPGAGAPKVTVSGRVWQAAVAHIQEGDRQVGQVIVLRDITRLDEIDRLKTKFVSDVSHELRTPVANLSLYLQLLEHGKPEKHAEYMTILENQAARLAHLIENILDLSRLERDKDALVFAPVDLNAAVEPIVTAHRPRAEAAGLALIFEPSASLPRVRAESNRLSQVVANLVTNAVNYTPAGQVRIRTCQTGKQVCLEVQDTGIGINPGDMPHLFERFYRGTSAAQLDIPGSGLGLGIVKEIVDLHGGHIEVESRLGEGSTFRVCLPLAERTSG